ncbi:MAG: hypothetical protein AAF220_01885 [Pseudomonadota bacterium]
MQVSVTFEDKEKAWLKRLLEMLARTAQNPATEIALNALGERVDKESALDLKDIGIIIRISLDEGAHTDHAKKLAAIVDNAGGDWSQTIARVNGGE